MIRFPNAKINLGLFVTEKRDDGFHNIESILYPVPFHDILELKALRSGLAPKFETTGLSIPCTVEQNICYKAYALLKEEFNILPFSMHLHKITPMGAGLGGGSADGAFVINMLDEICELNLSKKEKALLSLDLGSDCAFFIENTPCFASGRGEELMPVYLNLKGKYLALVFPKVHSDTGKAYSKITPRSASFDLKKINSIGIKEWKDHIVNDFEDPIFEQYPVLGEIKNSLYEQGAEFALMSGSGSTIYGIFDEKTDLNLNPYEVKWLDL